MLVLKVRRLAREMRLERLLQSVDVVRMDPVDPFLRPTYACESRADQSSPSIALRSTTAGSKIPLPQPVIRTFRRKREPLFASLECVFGARPIGDVLPEQRDATANRKDFDLQNPRTRSRRQPDVR